jgi:hypothetical protein
MTPSLRFVVATALGTALAVASPLAPVHVAFAQDDAASNAARQHYEAGTKAFADRRFEEAALNFEAAATEKANPIGLFSAALAWEQANHSDRAADDYARALAGAGLPADKTASAKDRIASLEGVLGMVSVTGPEGARVQLDSNTELPTPATLHGSAGVHTLSVRVPNRPIERRPLVLERGQTSKMDVTAAMPTAAGGAGPASKDTGGPSTPPQQSPASEPPASRPLRTIGFVALGVGGAMLLGGVVLGVEALDARNAYNAAPTGPAFDHANGLATWTTVAFVAGGVVAAGGLVLVLLPASRAEGSSSPVGPREGQKGEVLMIAPTLGGLVLKGVF